MGKIVEHRLLSDHHAPWKPGTSGGILDVGQFFGAQRAQRNRCFRKFGKRLRRATKTQAKSFGCFAEERKEIFSRHSGIGPATQKQAAQLIHIGFSPTHMNRCRQRHRHQSGILAGKEKTNKIRVGVCYQRHASAALKTQTAQAVGQRLSLVPQF